MTHAISWYVPEKVLLLEMMGQPSAADMKQINDDVMAYINSHSTQLNLVIDTRDLDVGYETGKKLRATQKYTQDYRLRNMWIISNDKLIRLVTLIAFSMSRAHFAQFENFDQEDQHLRRMGLL